jgi:hypothetical protein
MSDPQIALSELNAKIARYAQVRLDLANAEATVSVIKAEKEQLTDEIMEALKGASLKSYKHSDLGTLSLVQRPTVKVTDPVKVAFWLKMNGFDLEQYTKLDSLRVRPVLEEAAIAQGEVIEGAEIETNEYLSLRKPKQ